jgi:YVTN family beta-propeller protein
VAHKCVAIVSPFPTQSLQPGVSGQSITYTLQVDPTAPGSGLGSGSIQPTAGSGITFTGVTTSVPGANCFVSSAGAATCLGLGQTAGHVFTITVSVNVSCAAGGDSFATLWSGASDFRNDPNGRGDQYLLDSASAPYLQEVVTGGCGLAFVSEPATALVGAGISSLVGAAATADPVQVQVLNESGQPSSTAGVPVTIALGSGGPAGATLSGTLTEATNAAGVASFPTGAAGPLSIDTVGTYQLVASSPGYGTTTSGTSTASPGVGAFDVVDAETSCAVAATCSTSGTAPDGTSYTVQYTNNSGASEILTSGIGQASYTCGTYTPSSDSLTTAVFNAGTGLPDPSAVTTNHVSVPSAHFASTDRICFGSTTPIPESSVAPGYGCDPNAVGNPCDPSLDGVPQFFAVLNTCSSEPSGLVPVGSAPHSVAVAAEDGTVYVANTFDSTVSVIQAATNAVIATIAVGSNPQGLAFDAATNTVWVANEGSGTVSVIDAAPFDVSDNTVLATITVGGNPEEAAADALTDTVYVSVDNGNASPGSVVTINDIDETVGATIPVGDAPFGVAVDQTTDTVYVANDHSDSVSVIDGGTDAVTATITVGAGLNPDPGSGPFGIAVDETTDTVYVAVDDQSSVAVIDGGTNSVTTNVALAGTPYGVAVDAATDNVYVAVNSASDLAVIDGTTNALAGTLATGTSPWALAVNPSTAMAYVANAGSDTVSAVALVGAPCENFDHPITEVSGVVFQWQSVGDPTGRDA